MIFPIFNRMNKNDIVKGLKYYVVALFLSLLFFNVNGQTTVTVPKRGTTTVNIFIKDTDQKPVVTKFTLVGLSTGTVYKLKTNKKGLVQFTVKSGERYSVNLKERPNYDVLTAEKSASHLYNFKIQYDPNDASGPELNPLKEGNLQPSFDYLVVEVFGQKYRGEQVVIAGYTNSELINIEVPATGRRKVLVPKGDWYTVKWKGATLIDSLHIRKDKAMRTVVIELRSAPQVRKVNEITPESYLKVYVEDAFDVYKNTQLNPVEAVIVPVVQRHPEWKKTLAIIDVTGSMYPYFPELAKWQELYMSLDDHELHFVFFNDSVNSSNSGFYYAKASDKEEVKKVLTTAILAGNGGDEPENDLAAILDGIANVADFDEVILVADNYSSVKNMELLKTLQVPVKVILCGANELNPPHEDYVTIASRTGGSLHTIQRDILDVSSDLNQK